MGVQRILVVDDSSTIRQVVSLILTKAGIDVTVAEDGEEGLKLVKSNSFDLILLDFVMPKVNGHQFCQSLIDFKDPPPVVLMSARGDQIGDRFVSQNRVVDYITKPFSPESLLAVTDAAMRQKQPRVRGLTVAPETKRSNLLSNLRASLAKRLADAGILDSTMREAFVEFFDDNLTVEFARNVLTQANNSLAMYGNLSILPLAEILQLLELQNQTGILWVRSRHQTARIAFLKGKLMLALGSGLSGEHVFGKIVIRENLLSEQELNDLLKTRASTSAPIGKFLVGCGKLTEEQLQHVLKKQTCEIIYETLRWQKGTFEFETLDELPRNVTSAQITVGVQGLVMEGLRRIDEWHLIEDEIRDFDEVFLACNQNQTHWGEAELTLQEKKILSMLDGQTTLKEVIQSSHSTSFDVANIVYRFLTAKLVKRARSSVER